MSPTSQHPRPEVLISEERIAARVDELAAQISADYADADDLLLVGVLRGAFIFLADLSRALSIPCAVDFLSVASYDGTEQGGVRLILDLRKSIEGRHVLLVEDIVDSGHTLEFLARTLRARQPASLKTCALTRKPGRLEVDAPVDYLGFDIPDEWVVGYGLDLDDRGRALPYIGVVDPTTIEG
ncbi:MAG TPA: hypoxanthine phosphoribosyltransferase [Thermoanaerobaculia bacterium]|nr:hypoxanthine phosphoribosyltransferase [Thermoanaerobaculia bacterium]